MRSADPAIPRFAKACFNNSVDCSVTIGHDSGSGHAWRPSSTEVCSYQEQEFTQEAGRGGEVGFV
jgi:hypothetical protein